MKKGKLVILSAPSGTENNNLQGIIKKKSVSATTREKGK